jgi:hypothetical protein
MPESSIYQNIIAPLLPLLKKEAKHLQKDNYTLSLYFFTINLCYAIISGIRSIRLLITESKTSKQAEKLGIIIASSSMYSEAFSRYDPMIFKRIFLGLIHQLEFKEIPEIHSLGRFILMDGSIFPAIKTMEWASYKKTTNGIKLHLSFELNRMIPVQFITTDANGSERKILKSVLERGVTYITDRGYIGFNLFSQIINQSAFFIIRVKSNMDYNITDNLESNIPKNWDKYLNNVTDNLVTFIGDDQENIYRLIMFNVNGESYQIATNRFDLQTHEIIMLYAYRWQIELFFRCIKRCFNCLHLWTHESKGIEIQFYLYMIVYILLLHFKQNIQADEEIIPSAITEENINPNDKSIRTPNCGIVTLLGDQLKSLWKIGIHWLKAVKNMLLLPLDTERIKILNVI